MSTITASESGDTAPAKTSIRSRLRSVLAIRDFRLLMIGNLLTQLGQWTQQIGRGWLIWEMTHSELQLGIVAFCSGISMFLMAPVGGALSDRMERKKVILASQVGLMIVAIALALLVTTDSIQLWHLYVTALLSGGLFSLNGPTRNAMVHDLVGQKALTSAITLNSMTMNSMRVIGPALGGLMIGIAGVEGTFWIQAACYVFSISQVLQIRTPSIGKSSKKGSFFGSIKDGVVYISREPLLRPLIIIAFITGLLGMAYIQLMPAYVGDVLEKEGGTLGLIMMAEGIGAFIGSVIATVLGEVKWRGKMLIGVVAAFGLFLILLAFVSNIPLAMLVLFFLGMVNSTVLITNNILIQTHVSEEYRGRVFSIYFLTFSLTPLGTLIAGGLAEVIALQSTFLILGSIVMASALFIGHRSQKLRQV